MSFYSAQQSGESVMKKSGFEIDIPSGEGWYPFVMTFNATGFRQWSGIDADMSIMYNFGAFDLCTRTSSIYDADSDRYSSFYGAYVIKGYDGAFGFSEDGKLDIDEMTAAVEYDYTVLVMSAFGCADPVFSVGGYEIEEGEHIADSGGWTRVDAVITANGCAHNYKGYKQPYLQYGRPMEAPAEDFAPVNMYGRVYAKYFEEYGCTVMLYVIAPDREVIGRCDDEILKNAVIRRLQHRSDFVCGHFYKLLKREADARDNDIALVDGYQYLFCGAFGDCLCHLRAYLAHHAACGDYAYAANYHVGAAHVKADRVLACGAAYGAVLYHSRCSYRVCAESRDADAFAVLFKQALYYRRPEASALGVHYSYLKHNPLRAYYTINTPFGQQRGVLLYNKHAFWMTKRCFCTI